MRQIDRETVEKDVKTIEEEWYESFMKKSAAEGISTMPMQEKSIIEEIEAFLTDEIRTETARSGLITTTDEIMDKWNAIHGMKTAMVIHLISLLKPGELGIQEAADEAISRGFDNLHKLLAADPSTLGRFVDPALLLEGFAFRSSRSQQQMSSGETLRQVQKMRSVQSEWTSLIRRSAAGMFSGACHLAFYHKENTLPTLGGSAMWPSIHITKDGTRYWCLLRHAPTLPASSPLIRCWAVRDTSMLKNNPMSMVLVDEISGVLLWQNPASTSLIGCHSLENNIPSPGEVGKKRGLDYLSMLFECQEHLRQEMLEVVKIGGQFDRRVEIKSSVVKRWLGLEVQDPLWHKIRISRGHRQDPFTLRPTLCIVQSDETEAQLSAMRLHVSQMQQQALLSQILPQQVTEVLLTRLEVKGKLVENAFNTGIDIRRRQGSLSEEVDEPLSGLFSTTLLSAPSSDNLTLTRQNISDLSTHHEEVSILFADIKGFTAMSSLLSPAQVMLMLNDIFSKFDDLLDDFDVYKVETIGDCFVAATGLFDRQDGEGTGGRFGPHKDRLDKRRDGGWVQLGGQDSKHAEKMLAFALALSETASLVASPLGGKIEVRVGIHSGPGHSGVVGRKMPRFCLFGDTINTASRMETSGEPGRIHVSESIAALIPEVSWEERAVQVKGKGEMKTFFYPENTSYAWPAQDSAADPEHSTPCMSIGPM